VTRLLAASLAVSVLAASYVASAQTPSPLTPPNTTGSAAGSASAGSAAAEAAPPPLAQLRDDKQLAEALAQITQDASVLVDNPKVRPLAQALLTEGVKQLRNHAYDQALANFLEAYAKLPSPRILLNIGSTLHEMGRLADAANTYQRFLGDPASGTDRIAEVKSLLVELDHELTILTVRVMPHGSDISIDGGPYMTVGSTLLTRVRPGIHLVRVKKGAGYDEVTVNGFEAEDKEVYAAVKMEVDDGNVVAVGSGSGSAAAPPMVVAAGSGTGSAAAVTATTGAGSAAPPAAPDHVDAWLDVGTLYATSDPTSRERHVKTSSSSQGTVVSAIVPNYDVSADNTAIIDTGQRVSSGVIAMVRIDGRGGGFAGGLGIAYAANDHFEIEVAGLRSSEWGIYLGARYRFLLGQFRPYVGLGVPIFFYSTTNDMTGATSSSVAGGGRIAGGLELEINGHLSVMGDLGYEHFFNVSGTPFIADVFVPTIAVIGRL
jgi:hypothetical protein